MNPIWVDPERMSGTPCFTGTRVPVATLFELLERGRTIEDFLDGFPTVPRSLVLSVLAIAKDSVIPPAQRPVSIPHAAGAA